tara:strand:+ start:656 stop:1117 length:462 start_codon:yes stop_codon:yes gene_type:complete
MINKEDIIKVSKEKIEEIGGFFVDIKINLTNSISLYFDRIDGVSIDHCLQISRHIEQHFDRDIEDYDLTVCSAGLDKPFKVPRQYIKYIGHEVGVLLKNGIKYNGVILSLNDNILKLETLKKKKVNKKRKIYKEELLINLLEIKETKLKIKWK